MKRIMLLLVLTISACALGSERKYDDKTQLNKLTPDEQEQLNRDLFTVIENKQKKSPNDVLREVKSLVEKGAQVNARAYATRLTPLMKATDLAIVRYLVEQGAHINAQEAGRFTPLMIASDSGHLDIVRYLIEHGADIHVRESLDQTALMRAALNSHFDVVEYLVQHGAGINDRDFYDRTPLMESLSCINETFKINNALAIVKYLIEHGAHVNAQERNSGKTVFDYASDADRIIRRSNPNYIPIAPQVRQIYERYRQQRIAEERARMQELMPSLPIDLANLTAEYTHEYPYIDPILEIKQAIQAGNLDLLTRILKGKYIDVNMRDETGVGALLYALQARPPNLAIISLLLSHGADINLQNRDRVSPLSYAQDNNLIDAITGIRLDEYMRDYGRYCTRVRRFIEDALTQYKDSLSFAKALKWIMVTAAVGTTLYHNFCGSKL